jgi:hypothetical protein
MNSIQDRENAIIDQALPSKRPSITKQGHHLARPLQ